MGKRFYEKEVLKNRRKYFSPACLDFFIGLWDVSQTGLQMKFDLKNYFYASCSKQDSQLSLYAPSHHFPHPCGKPIQIMPFE